MHELSHRDPIRAPGGTSVRPCRIPSRARRTGHSTAGWLGLLPAIVMLGLTVACGGEGGTGPTVLPSEVSGKLDGVAFSGAGVAAVRGGGLITLSATVAGGATLQIRFPDLAGPTHLVAVGSATSSAVTRGSSTWIATNAAGSGEVILTTFSRGRVEGSYRFTLAPSAGSASPVQVTEGRFIARFP